MWVDLTVIPKNSTVAVALSGGCDSMVLLYYLQSQSAKYNFKVIALNVEHGIRGEESLKDTAFVIDYCNKNSIPLLRYSCDSIKRATDEKLTIEEAARKLRYSFFKDAIDSGKCDLVATAHHLRDNAESVIFNLCRGTGIKGLSGICSGDKVIRPFINTSKQEIEEYARVNSVPYVIDSTNLCDDYTRNYIRHNILPSIEKVFPEAEKSIARLSFIAREQSEYIEKQVEKIFCITDTGAEIILPADDALIRVATIKALQACHIEKDWTKTHTDDIIKLSKNVAGKVANLPKNVYAVREYDKIAFYTSDCKNSMPNTYKSIPFAIGEFYFGDTTISIENASENADLKSGLFLDADTIPKGAVIRTMGSGDMFTKFGGGSKKLCDYFTDKKIPREKRKYLPLIAYGSEIYAIFGVAISQKVKVTNSTKRLIKIKIK